MHEYENRVNMTEAVEEMVPWIVISESLLMSYNLMASSNSIWHESVQGSPENMEEIIKTE